MSMTLEEALAEALDDEYRARATYQAVLDAFGNVRPFVNIVESEGRHIDALLRLYERYGMRAPGDPWMGRIQPPASVAAACQAGVEAERENAVLYERLFAAAERHPDVEETFRRLYTASQENHLPAFERGLRREQNRGAGEDDHSPGRQQRRRHRGGRGDGKQEG